MAITRVKSGPAVGSVNPIKPAQPAGVGVQEKGYRAQLLNESKALPPSPARGGKNNGYTSGTQVAGSVGS